MQSSQNSETRERSDPDSRLQELLLKTSRTFALAIPQLPQPTRREVTIAYLLFRIADTLEDASVLWTRSQQHAALDDFDGLMLEPRRQRARELAARWQSDPPSEHPGYIELLAETPFVIESFLGLSPQAQETIAGHSRRTAQQMADFVTKTAGGVLQLDDIDDLRQYCYAVAGIVGEMLTDLFLLGSEELAGAADYLRARAVAFGEGLQLVNILKDSDSDAVEGRNYLPDGVSRDDVFALARSDLEAATEYALTLQQAGGPDGVVAFTALPVELAWATLDKVEREGPGAKITRDEVFSLYEQVHQAIAAGRPVMASRSAPEVSARQ